MRERSIRHCSPFLPIRPEMQLWWSDSRKWAGRWSPLVEIDGQGLRLDVSGIAHLFGDERGLVDDIRRCFARMGLTVRVAIAPTGGGCLGVLASCTRHLR